MADKFKNDTYLGLIQMLGSTKSGVFINQLFKDVIQARNDLIKAQSQKSLDILDAATHVLSSLAGTVGISDIHQLARDVNDQIIVADAPFPKEDVIVLLADLELWIDFLSLESQNLDLKNE